MADYDLGTAHGKIRVDYDDKGFKDAGKDMDQLADQSDQMATAFEKARAKIVAQYAEISARAREMAAQANVVRAQIVDQYSAISARAQTMAATIGQVRQRLGGDLQGMSDKAEQFAETFGAVVGLVAFSVGTFSRAGQTMETLAGPMGIVNSLGIALGNVPDGTEGFPESIRNVIRLAAAITAFRGSMFLLAGLAARFRGLRFASPLLRGLGSSIFALSAPLQAVSGLALDVAFMIREFRFIKSIAKFVLMATGAFAGLGGAIWVVTGLAQAVAQLSGVAGLLPGVLATVGIAIGTLKVGMAGFFDAVKSGDFSQLSGEAALAAGTIRSFRRVWDELQNSVQDRLFQGITSDINQLGVTYLPIMERGMVGVAGALNHGVREAAGFMKTASAQRDVNTLFMNAQGIIRNLANAVAPLISVFLDVATVASGMLQEMTLGAGESARGFAAFVREARESGRLREWIQGGIDALKDLWAIVKTVGRIMTTIFSGLNGGEDVQFLQRMREGAEGIEAFLKSAEGQEVLGMLGDAMERAATNVRRLADAFMQYILPAIRPFIPVLQAVSDAIIDGLVNAIGFVAPIFQGIGTALAPIAPLIGFIVQGMAQTTFVIMGLLLAFKLLGAVFLIFSSGLRAVRGALAVAGFAFRLFTGTLRGGEVAALRFAWMLIKSIGRGIRTWIVGIAQGIAANTMWVLSTIRTAIVTAAQWLWAKTVIIAHWIAMRIAAAASAIWTATVWVAQTIWARVVIIANWLAIRTALFLLWLGFRLQALASAIAVGAAWIAGAIAARVSLIATWIATNAALAASWLILRIQALAASIATGAAWLAGAIAARAMIIGAWIVTNAQLAATWVLLRIQAAASAIAVGVVWLVQSAIAGAGIVAAWLGARIAVIAGWISMVAASVAGSIAMAAAWLFSVWPVALVIAIIVGLVALIIYNWDTIVAATAAAWALVTENVIRPVQEFTTQAQIAIGQFIQGVVDFWNQLVADTQAQFAAWGESIGAAVDTVVAFFAALPGQIMGFLSALPGQLLQLGINMVQGLMNGLATIGGKIVDFLMQKAREALDAVLNFFGIASPSKVMIWVGKMIGLGWIRGIVSMKDKVANEAGKMAEGVQKAVTGPVTAAMEILQALNDGRTVFSDLSFRYMSDNANLWNDDLIAAMKASGISDPRVFLEQYIAKANANPSGGAVALPAPKANPYARARGGDGAVAPSNIIESVTIDARSVAEMNSVIDFFDKVQQKARAGNGGS